MNKENKGQVVTGSEPVTLNKNEMVQSMEPNSGLEVFDIKDVKSIEGKKRKFPFKLLMVLLILVLLGFSAFRAYGYFSKNPTAIIKIVVNNMYSKFESTLKSIEEETFDLDILNSPVKVSGELSFSDSTFPELKQEKWKYAVLLDYSKKQSDLSIDLVKSNKSLGDVKAYLRNDHMYLKSNTLFDNLYDAGESRFDDMFNLSGLEDFFKKKDDLTDEDVLAVVRGIKDTFLNSLDEAEMSISKENLFIDGETIQTNKITYKISEESMDNFRDKISVNILNNDDLVTKISDMFNIDEVKIRDYFENDFKKIEEDEKIDDGEFSIYTTGLDYKCVKVQVTSGEDNFTYTSYKDKSVLSVGPDGSSFKVVSVKNGDVYDVDVYIENEVGLRFKVRQFDSENIDLDYTILEKDTESSGSLKISSEVKSSKEMHGEVDFSLSGNVMGVKTDYNLKFTYDLSSGKLENVDTNKALKDFSEEDTEKLLNSMNVLDDSAYARYFDTFLDRSGALQPEYGTSIPDELE